MGPARTVSFQRTQRVPSAISRSSPDPVTAGREGAIPGGEEEAQTHLQRSPSWTNTGIFDLIISPSKRGYKLSCSAFKTHKLKNFKWKAGPEAGPERS